MQYHDPRATPSGPTKLLLLVQTLQSDQNELLGAKGQSSLTKSGLWTQTNLTLLQNMNWANNS